VAGENSAHRWYGGGERDLVISERGPSMHRCQRSPRRFGEAGGRVCPHWVGIGRDRLATLLVCRRVARIFSRTRRRPYRQLAVTPPSHDVLFLISERRYQLSKRLFSPSRPSPPTALSEIWDDSPKAPW